jgi:phosphotransferase system HPr-like phosphotransfer protein
MRILKVNMPETGSISVIGFTLSLVGQAHLFTSEEINIMMDDKVETTTNLKSLLGLFTNYWNSKSITLTISGENEDYAYTKLSVIVPDLIKEYSK